MIFKATKSVINGLGSTVADFYNAIDEHADIDESRILSHSLSLGNPVLGFFLEKAIDRYGDKFSQVYSNVKDKIGDFLSTRKEFENEEINFEKESNDLSSFGKMDVSKEEEELTKSIKKIQKDVIKVKKKVIKANGSPEAALDNSIVILKRKVNQLKAKRSRIKSPEAALDESIRNLENEVNNLISKRSVSPEAALDRSISTLKRNVNGMPGSSPEGSLDRSISTLKRNVNGMTGTLTSNGEYVNVNPKVRFLIRKNGDNNVIDFLADILNDILLEIKLIRSATTGISKVKIKPTDISATNLSQIISDKLKDVGTAEKTYTIPSRPTLSTHLKAGREYSYEYLMTSLTFENLATNYFIYKTLTRKLLGKEGIVAELVSEISKSWEVSLYHLPVIKQIYNSIAYLKFGISGILNNLEVLSGITTGLLYTSAMTSSFLSLGFGAAASSLLGGLSAIGIGSVGAYLIKKAIAYPFNKLSQFHHKQKINKLLPGEYSKKIPMLYDKDAKIEDKAFWVQLYSYERLAEISNGMGIYKGKGSYLESIAIFIDILNQRMKQAVAASTTKPERLLLTSDKNKSEEKEKSIVETITSAFKNDIDSLKEFWNKNNKKIIVASKIVGVAAITYFGSRLGKFLTSWLPKKYPLTKSTAKIGVGVVAGLASFLLAFGEPAMAINALGFGLVAVAMTTTGTAIYETLRNLGGDKFTSTLLAGAGAISIGSLILPLVTRIIGSGPIISTISTALTSTAAALFTPAGLIALAGLGITAGSYMYLHSIQKDINEMNESAKKHQKAERGLVSLRKNYTNYVTKNPETVVHKIMATRSLFADEYNRTRFQPTKNDSLEWKEYLTDIDNYLADLQKSKGIPSRYFKRELSRTDRKAPGVAYWAAILKTLGADADDIGIYVSKSMITPMPAGETSFQSAEDLFWDLKQNNPRFKMLTFKNGVINKIDTLKKEITEKTPDVINNVKKYTNKAIDYGTKKYKEGKEIVTTQTDKFMKTRAGKYLESQYDKYSEEAKAKYEELSPKAKAKFDEYRTKAYDEIMKQYKNAKQYGTDKLTQYGVIDAINKIKQSDTGKQIMDYYYVAKNKARNAMIVTIDYSGQVREWVLNDDGTINMEHVKHSGKVIKNKVIDIGSSVKNKIINTARNERENLEDKYYYWFSNPNDTKRSVVRLKTPQEAYELLSKEEKDRLLREAMKEEEERKAREAALRNQRLSPNLAVPPSPPSNIRVNEVYNGPTISSNTSLNNTSKEAHLQNNAKNLETTLHLQNAF